MLFRPRYSINITLSSRPNWSDSCAWISLVITINYRHQLMATSSSPSSTSIYKITASPCRPGPTGWSGSCAWSSASAFDSGKPDTRQRHHETSKILFIMGNARQYKTKYKASNIKRELIFDTIPGQL